MDTHIYIYTSDSTFLGELPGSLSSLICDMDQWCMIQEVDGGWSTNEESCAIQTLWRDSSDLTPEYWEKKWRESFQSDFIFWNFFEVEVWRSASFSKIYLTLSMLWSRNFKCLFEDRTVKRTSEPCCVSCSDPWLLLYNLNVQYAVKVNDAAPIYWLVLPHRRLSFWNLHYLYSTSCMKWT